jgi:hypothetical protein
MKIILLTTSLIIAFALLFACSNDLESDTKMGRLTVQLTDAPFPYEMISEANVTIFKIDARLKESSMEDKQDTEDTEGGSSFVVLSEEEREVNLIKLTNGITETLVDIDVPEGSYDLIRIYVKGVNVVLTNGNTFNLKVPSGEQTGIKVFIKPSLFVGGELSSDLLLDFDVSRSFIPKGNMKNIAGITGFNFKPVIKACNLTTAGTLSGLVSTTQNEEPIGLEGATVSVFAADTLNTSTFTDESGNYTIMGLIAGSYDVMVELEGYESQTTEEVTIVAGNKIIQDFDLVPVP